MSDFKPCEPQKEEERLPDGFSGDNNNRDRVGGEQPKDLSKQENYAFWLAAGCLIALIAIWMLNSTIVPESGSDLTRQIFDILKYVVTTALGYFFAAQKNKR